MTNRRANHAKALATGRPVFNSQINVGRGVNVIAMVPVTATMMGRALSRSYGAGQGKSADSFFENHIQGMKSSTNPTIERTGRVLEAVKVGFGVGYLGSVIAIATGQLILGNPLDVILTVGSAVTLTNPVAATCAAVGAIFYGYQALSSDEKQALVETVSKGFEIGIEIVRAIIRFCIDNLRQILSEDNLKEIKGFVKSAAESFGGTLGTVTGAISSVLGEKLSDASLLVGAVSATAGRTVTVAAVKAGQAATASLGYVSNGVVAAATGISGAISLGKLRGGVDESVHFDPQDGSVADKEHDSLAPASAKQKHLANHPAPSDRTC